MSYPSTLTTYTNPNATDRLNSPSHSSIESAQNGGLFALETFVGTLASTAGTLIYDIRSSNSNGGGHVQTANKGGTGQIIYNQGDILVGQSSSVLTKLAVGATNGYALVVDNTQSIGIKWGVPGNVPTMRVYSNPSILTWSKPSNLAYIIVQTQASGGGGGSTAVNTFAPGGAGGYAIKVISASVLGATETVNIGSCVGSTFAGGFSSFGTTSYLSSRGGQAGASANSGDAAGGTGGASSGGDVNITGGDGGIAYYIGGAIAKPLNPKTGGSGFFGNGSYGSGGHIDTLPGNGVVIVTEY